MANEKISALTEVTNPISTDVLPIVSGGETKKVKLLNLNLYTQYVALLNQADEENPVATVLVNTIGSIVWTRWDVGVYFGTLTAAFSDNKTVAFLSIASADGSLGYAYTQSGVVDRIVVSTLDINADTITPADSRLMNASIEIRVYP